MASAEHLAMLKEGVDAWNAWRYNSQRYETLGQHARSKLDSLSSDAILSRPVDLVGADLTHINLQRNTREKLNLNGADLRYADLGGVNFESVNLGDANLSNAQLEGANLSYSDLSRANFSDACLRNVVFNRALLSGTNLMRADLTGARMRGAIVEAVAYAGSRIGKAIDLEHCIFAGGSALDLYTIRENWPLPPGFLRGCGLPDDYIDYLPSHLSRPLDYYTAFISYAGSDEEFANRLHTDLEYHSVCCWFAPEDMKIGDRIRERIDESIRVYDKLLLVLSVSSVRSDWVEDEVEAAFERERREGKRILFPVRLDDSVMETDCPWAAKIRRQVHIGDFTNWKHFDYYQPSFVRLLKALRSKKLEEFSDADEIDDG